MGSPDAQDHPFWSVQWEVLIALFVAWMAGTVVVYALSIPGIVPVADVLYLRSAVPECLIAAIVALFVIVLVACRTFDPVDFLSSPAGQMPATVAPNATAETPTPVPVVSSANTTSLLEDGLSAPGGNGSSTDAVSPSGSLVATALYVISVLDWPTQVERGLVPAWKWLSRLDLGKDMSVEVAAYLAEQDGSFNAAHLPWGKPPLDAAVATLVPGLRVLSRVGYTVVAYGLVALVLRFAFSSQLKQVHDYFYDQLYLKGRTVKEMPGKARKWLRKRMEEDGPRALLGD